MLEEGSRMVVKAVDRVLGKPREPGLGRSREAFDEVLTEACFLLVLGEVCSSHRDIERLHVVGWICGSGIRWTSKLFIRSESDIANPSSKGRLKRRGKDDVDL